MAKRGILLLLFVLILVPFTTFALVVMQTRWGFTESLETGYHLTDDGAVVGSSLYVVGQAQTSGASTWRIEKRNLSDGSLVYATTSNPSSGSDEAHHVAVDSSYMYVTGHDNSPGNLQWRLEKRNLSDGSLVYATSSNPSSASDIPYDTDLDSTYLYISGSDRSSGNYAWLIEKRALSDGSLVYATTSNPTGGTDRPFGMRIDSSHMYVTGNSGSNWLIEKRALADGSLTYATTTSGFSGIAYGIVTDSSHMYVVGSAGSAGRIEKRLLSDGSLVYATSANSAAVPQVALFAAQKDTERLYVGGYAIISGRYYWYTARHNLSDGSLIDYIISSAGSSACWGSIYSLVLNDGVVYPFGEMNDDACSTAIWRLEAYDLTPPPTITSFSPAARSVQAGSGGFTLTLNGHSFSSNTTNLTFGGVAKTATFVSSSQMTINLSSSEVVQGVFPIVIPNDTSSSPSGYFNYLIEGPSGSGGASEAYRGPWVVGASSAPIQAAPKPPVFQFLKDLKYLQIDPDVRKLQEFLNQNGFPISLSGPGSARNETTKFGALTKAALIRFQEAHAEQILKPNNLSKGSGFFGPATRGVVNTMLSR